MRKCTELITKIDLGETMNKSEFNKRELELIDDIQTAESYVSGDNDLEIDSYNDGWYACEYNGDESRIMDSYSNEPLITNEEIEKYKVNIYKVLDYCNVYYCG